MRPQLFDCRAVGVALLWAALVDAGHGGPHHHAHDRRRHLERPHHFIARSSTPEPGPAMSHVAHIEKRKEKCRFPTDAGLVAVTPDSKNAGWAMSPDQPCKPDSYCPYACPPGQLMAQWDPDATEYSYPQSQNGGLYCDESGEIKKPFPDKPYCVDGTGSIGCRNKAKGNVAICQTVLPGNEAMLIPTDVQDWAGLAVPDPSYWASTAAHFYINPPGTSTDEACIWGTNQHPIGNWSPFVAGANSDANGQTFVKVGWNPIYLEPETPFRNEVPTWGIKIECDGDGCNGLPCGIDPSKHKVNECYGSTDSGAGGANFCVVTVPKGVKANVVVFEAGNGAGEDGGSSGGDDGGDDGGEDESSHEASSSEPPPSSEAPSEESSSEESSSEESSTSSSSESSPAPSTTSSSSTTETVEDSFSTTSSTASSTSDEPTSSSDEPTSATDESTSTTDESGSTSALQATAMKVQQSPHILLENVTSTEDSSSSSSSSSPSSSSATTSSSSSSSSSSSLTPSSPSAVAEQATDLSTTAPQQPNAGCATQSPALGLALTTMFLIVLTFAI